MRGNRCEVYINDVKSKLFPLGSSGCRSNLPAALFGMTVSINEAGKEKENITKQRDSKKNNCKQSSWLPHMPPPPPPPSPAPLSSSRL